MRDPGLSEAIQAVGGVSELARRIGISQPSVSNWDKIPAERVLAVEAATGIARMRLRPDLYREQPRRRVDEIDLARAQEYALLSALLARAPDARLLAAARAPRRRREPARGSRMSALGEAAARADGERGRARVLRSVHRARARRAAALRLLLSHRLPQRAAARAAARRSRGVRHRARRGKLRAGGSRRDLVRDHGGVRRRTLRGAGRRGAQRCSRSTWRRGSAASSPISSAPRRRDFYRAVGALGRVFIDDRDAKPSRCRVRPARSNMSNETPRRDIAMQSKDRGRRSAVASSFACSAPARPSRRRRAARDTRHKADTENER